MTNGENSTKLPRTPPAAVRAALRREVGFGCPVPGCGSPFLEWHHFDPPWHDRHHHEIAGMIALCSTHHPKADGGAYTVDQLRKFKADAAASRSSVEAKFEWLRHRLVVVAGGNFSVNTMNAVIIGGKRAIWLTRDADDHLLLNLDASLLTKSGAPRVQMEDSYWTSPVTEIDDLACPPNGRIVDIRYKNGDRYQIEFVDVPSMAAAFKRYDLSAMMLQSYLPFVAVEINCDIFGSTVRLTSAGTEVEGTLCGGNVFVNGEAAFNIAHI